MSRYRYWTKEDALAAGQAYIATHTTLVKKDLQRDDTLLPSTTVIVKHFGTLSQYRVAIGLPRGEHGQGGYRQGGSWRRGKQR